jgi:hypothetical protein
MEVLIMTEKVDQIVKMVQQQAHKNRQRVLMGNNSVRYKD